MVHRSQSTSPWRLDRKMRGLLTLEAPSAGSPFLPAPLGPRPASSQLPSSAAALAGVNHAVGNVAGLAVEQTAQPMPTDGPGSALLQDFQHVPLVLLGPGGMQNGPHGADRAAVLPNDLPHIFLRHPSFDDEGVLALHAVHAHLVWVVHSRFGHGFDELDHCLGVPSLQVGATWRVPDGRVCRREVPAGDV